MKLSPNLQVDHKDRKKFNSIRSNLRNATPSQNGCNNEINSRSTHGYKGIGRGRNAKKWNAYISIDKVHTYIGCYNSAEEAAIAYDLAALRYHREFACLNFPIENYVDQMERINQLIKADDYRASLKKIDRDGNLV